MVARLSGTCGLVEPDTWQHNRPSEREVQDVHAPVRITPPAMRRLSFKACTTAQPFPLQEGKHFSPSRPCPATHESGHAVGDFSRHRVCLRCRSHSQLRVALARCVCVSTISTKGRGGVVCASPYSLLGGGALCSSAPRVSQLTELSQLKFAGLGRIMGVGHSFEEKLGTPHLNERGLRLIYSAYTSWDGYEGAHPGYLTPAEHLQVLEREFACAAKLEAAVPGTLAHINVHGGCDSFDETESDAYYAGALDLTDALLRDVPTLTNGKRRGVSHETHRGRPLFHPTPTRLASARRGSAEADARHVALARCERASHRYASTTNGPANSGWGAEAAAAAAAAGRAPFWQQLVAAAGGAALERWRLHEEIFPSVFHSRIGSGDRRRRPGGGSVHCALTWRCGARSHMRASGATGL